MEFFKMPFTDFPGLCFELSARYRTGASSYAGMTAARPDNFLRDIPPAKSCADQLILDKRSFLIILPEVVFGSSAV